MKRIYVTGGSGFLGKRLIRMLKDTGRYHITAMAKSESSAAIVKDAGAHEVSLLDLRDGKLMKEALKSINVVVHAAALYKMGGTKETFYEPNVTGTANLISAAKASGVQKFIHIGSSGSVMGKPGPVFDLKDENAHIQTTAFAPFLESKALSEAIALESSTTTFKALVLRPSFIWGFDAPMIAGIFKDVRDGKFALIDHGSYPFTPVHVLNVCHAILLLIESNSANGAYFVTDDKKIEFREFFTRILQTRGLEMPKRSFSFSVAWGLAYGIELVWRLLRIKADPPLTRQMVRMIGQPFTLNIDRIKKELNYAPLISLDNGLREFNNSASSR